VSRGVADRAAEVGQRLDRLIERRDDAGLRAVERGHRYTDAQAPDPPAGRSGHVAPREHVEDDRGILHRAGHRSDMIHRPRQREHAVRGHRAVGRLEPTTPVSAAGTRIDARVSVPRGASPIPVATAIADPPLEQPGMRLGSCGLRLCGVQTPSANSCVAALPSSTAPPRRSLRTAAASSSGTTSYAADPARVGTPATSMMSFTVTGMPCSGPRRPPAANSLSISAAVARAHSLVTSTRALSWPLWVATAASAASVSATDVVRPWARSRAARARVGSGRPPRPIACHTCRDTGRPFDRSAGAGGRG
jgi:hypothetical protein